jgi:hypothetical protein
MEDTPTSIEVRDEAVPDDPHAVVIHFGAGPSGEHFGKFLHSVMLNYDTYIGVIPNQETGAFPVSVFIALNQDQERAILEAAKQGKFGSLPIHEVLDGTDHYLLPTTITSDSTFPEEVKRLHWDVVLSVPDLPEFAVGTTIRDLTEEGRLAVEAALRPVVEDLLARFDPRTARKPYVAGLQNLAGDDAGRTVRDEGGEDQ